MSLKDLIKEVERLNHRIRYAKGTVFHKEVLKEKLQSIKQTLEAVDKSELMRRFSRTEDTYDWDKLKELLEVN